MNLKVIFGAAGDADHPQEEQHHRQARGGAGPKADSALPFQLQMMVTTHPFQLQMLVTTHPFQLQMLVTALPFQLQMLVTNLPMQLVNLFTTVMLSLPSEKHLLKLYITIQ